ncbi:uncharacterized protein LOC122520506 [Polistes fuscatus]|uniref:uncharacterized protein LOC122520506 n=1 Tax=Polistes fuscatus TaxID=30207 RepID=UPI001CA97DA0|nr:uncharacterized protein LOC122520506 [Polistes fuscatus]
MATTRKLTATELREKLRARGLATYGTKAELIARLDLAEPHWRDEAILDATYDDGATALETPATEDGEVESLRRQVEDLMREVVQLRGTTEQRPRVNDRHREVSLSVISDMIDVFDGSVGTFTVWERRVRYIQRMHQLRDTEIVMIISLKLRGKALRWFHSKPEFVTYGMEELLAAIGKMFSSRQSVITLRRQFEERRWNGNESFRDYLHDKMILGYRTQLYYVSFHFLFKIITEIASRFMFVRMNIILVID